MSESERIRLARSLHDGIAQDLIGLSYRLSNLIEERSLDPSLKAELREIAFGYHALNEKVRDEIYALRSYGEDLLHEIEGFVALQRRDISFSITGAELAPLFPIDILPAIVELLRNSFTHSGASTVDVTFKKSDSRLHITIDDNGDGLIASRDGHYGISGVREILRTLSGSMEIIERERGHKICLSLPLSVH